MKTEEESVYLQLQQALSRTQIKTGNQIQNVKCPFQHPSTMTCINSKCTENAFICTTSQCKCKTTHVKCMKIQTKSFLQNILLRPVSLINLQSIIENKYQDLINLLSHHKEKLIQKLRKNAEYFGLTQNEEKFLRTLKNKNTEQINGSLIRSIVQTEQERKEQIHNIINCSIQDLPLEFTKVQSFLEDQFLLISSQIDQCQNDVKDFILDNYQKQQLKLKEPFQSSINLKSFDSKIIKSSDQLKKIKEFFNPKRIMKLQLLYRASSNNFNLNQFNKNCYSIKDTLVLIQNKFGKKFGAFTSHALCITNISETMQNQKIQFLFSLSNGDKFIRQTGSQSRMSKNINQIPDIYISNRANENNQSFVQINQNFKNEKYVFKTNGAWQQFHGNPFNNNFYIQEWQVWKVEFK